MLVLCISNFLKSIMIFVFIVLSQTTMAQLSKTHFIPPLTSSEFGNANPENQYLYLSTPSSTEVAYTIIPVGLPNTSYITGLVSNGNPAVINVGNGNGQLFVVSSQTSAITETKLR